jgi:hypothetical protein
MLALSRTTSPTAYRPMHRRTGLGAARTPADVRLRMVVRSAGPEKQHKQQRQRAMSEELERAVSVAKGLAAQQAEVVQAEQGRSKALARFEQALLQQLAMMQQEAARDARQLRDLVEQSSQARQESLEALQQRWRANSSRASTCSSTPWRPCSRWRVPWTSRPFWQRILQPQRIRQTLVEAAKDGTFDPLLVTLQKSSNPVLQKQAAGAPSNLACDYDEAIEGRRHPLAGGAAALDQRGGAREGG